MHQKVCHCHLLIFVHLITVNRAVYRIFGIRDAENMACLRDSLGLPSLKGMVEGRRIQFLDKLLVCDGATVIVQTYVNNLAFS